MLGYVDYIVLAVTLFISSAIGVYYHRNDNSKDYLLAGRSANPLTVAFSLMASFMSAITLLGVTFENYMYGTQFVLINLAYAIGTPIAAHVYLPVFFNLESPSAYAYLEKRFGLATRLVASLSFSLQMILYMGKCKVLIVVLLFKLIHLFANNLEKDPRKYLNDLLTFL